MLFNTPEFILFFIIISLIYLFLPNSAKKIYLLIVSYAYAYILGGIPTVVVLALITIFTFIFAKIVQKNGSNLYVVAFVVACVSVLIYGKYINTILMYIGKIPSAPELRLNVPAMIGLSYYILSAISYIVDIKKGKDEADTNILNLAVWLSFFPKIIAGPIERHKDFCSQIENKLYTKFDAERIKKGLLVAAWGYFLKIVIADRIGLFVDTVYGGLESNAGFVLLITMLLYSIQIYADFAGYSYIAYGIAACMGFTITNNFERPYFAKSMTEFWRRWHISLSSWLRDYIYFPLGGNRKGHLRQYFNIMVTFLVSGIWHGAGLSYMFWGALHGVYQVIEKFVKQNIKAEIKIGGIAKRIYTFLLASIAWVFFRANSLSEGFLFFKNLCAEWNPWVISDGTLTALGLDYLDWLVLLIAMMVMLMVETLQELKVGVYDYVMQQNIVVRWLIYYGIIIALIIFGIYGPQFDTSNFIYYKY